MTKKDKSPTHRNIPEKIIPSFHIEADARLKNMSVLIAGVIGVKGFSEEEIILITRRERIKISGNALKIAVFEGKTVEISGKIESLAFSVKESRREREK